MDALVDSAKEYFSAGSPYSYFDLNECMVKGTYHTVKNCIEIFNTNQTRRALGNACPDGRGTKYTPEYPATHAPGGAGEQLCCSTMYERSVLEK